MKPFISEPNEKIEEFPIHAKNRLPKATLSLLVVTSFGFALQVVSIFFPSRQMMSVYPAITWVRTFFHRSQALTLTFTIGYCCWYHRRSTTQNGNFITTSDIYLARCFAIDRIATFADPLASQRSPNSARPYDSLACNRHYSQHAYAGSYYAN